MRTRCEHQPVHARARAGHVSSSDPFGLRGFRARGDPPVPALPALFQDGKEGVDGSSPSEGFAKSPANGDFACLLQTPVTRGHSRARSDVRTTFARLRARRRIQLNQPI